MRVRTTQDSIRTAVRVLSLLIVGGCTIHVGSQDGGQNVTPTSILIKLVNLTDTALDPQIFVGAVADGLSRLYRASNRRTDLGLGGRGLVESGKDATLTVACDPPVFIATQGGAYGDNLDAPLGQGQPIVLEQDQNVYCGQKVTFTFSATRGGLNTTYSVEPQ
jgi:hypothetical protein